MPPVLEVEHLCIEFASWNGSVTAVDDVSFSIGAGEILGVVGESGAGKSVMGSAIIGLLDSSARIASGIIRFNGKRIDNLPKEAMRRIRGRNIASIFQDPLTSLNPLYTVGRQLIETIQAHSECNAQSARNLALELLRDVGIPAPEQRINAYPHTFSGGMRQRVVIALALCANPELIIADEPTTALDVSVQAQIMALLRRLCAERRKSIMLVSHDIGLISETASRVAVMYAGRVVEIGQVGDVIASPRHPYTAGLMRSIPAIGIERGELAHIPGAMPRLGEIPGGCSFRPRCPHAFQQCTRRPELVDVGDRSRVSCWLYGVGEASPPFSSGLWLEQPGSPPPHAKGALSPQFVQVRNLTKRFDVSPGWLTRIIERKPRRVLSAVSNVSFSIDKGRTFGIVGESGCGKSTLARVIVGLLSPTDGSVHLDGAGLASPSRRSKPLKSRARLQMIFQDPYASLNPRWRVRRIVAEPIRSLGIDTTSSIRRRVDDLLLQVGLQPRDGDKYPHEFSGGQRQRISIARALSSNPDFLICDEPTSALDVSVQAQVLNLMKRLQREFGLTYLFISHNLATVYYISHRVGVMYLGKLCEVADRDALFFNPRHPYTRLLLQAVPKPGGRPDDGAAPTGEVPNPLDPPSGCTFHPRCPSANHRCRHEFPALLQQRDGSYVSCHAIEEGRLLPEAAGSTGYARTVELNTGS
ncbi:MAG: dipeptide ABC transporter ATP-binding protein [Hyphomicrobiaceae bacterium]